MSTDSEKPFSIDLTEAMGDTFGDIEDFHTNFMHDYIRAVFTSFVRDYHVDWGLPLQDILADLLLVESAIRNDPETELGNAKSRVEELDILGEKLASGEDI